MPHDMMLIKSDSRSFSPATDADRELMSGWKIGHAMTVKATQANRRSLKHHRMYWGGLLTLAMDYWEPEGGLIGATEKKTLDMFALWLDRNGGNSGAIRNAAIVFMNDLAQSRSQRIQTPEKSIEALHRWVKVEAGYFEYEITPAGVRKIPLSINFNAMDQDEFNRFYKAAFSVVWKFILSRNFENEGQAEHAISILLSMV